MKTAIVALIFVVAGAFAASAYRGERKRLEGEKTAADAEWTLVNAALENRAVLMPQIAECVQKYAIRESAALRALDAAEAKLLLARTRQEKIDANNQLDGAIGHLLVVAENYPKMRTSADFLRWHDELERAENDLLQSRRRYNEALQKYNIDLSLFPANLVARLSGLARDNAYFRTDLSTGTAATFPF